MNNKHVDHSADAIRHFENGQERNKVAHRVIDDDGKAYEVIVAFFANAKAVGEMDNNHVKRLIEALRKDMPKNKWYGKIHPLFNESWIDAIVWNDDKKDSRRVLINMTSSLGFHAAGGKPYLNAEPFVKEKE